MANMSFNNNPFQQLSTQNASEQLGNTEATLVNKNKSPLFFKPYGACGTVTGSTHFIYHSQSDKYFAVDCGLLQGEGEAVENEVNQLPVKPKDLHALFLTHAHADHIGNLLQWMRAGFRGQIYCTEITAKLTLISLADILSHNDSEDEEELEEMLKLLPTLFVCPDTDSKADYGQLYPVHGVPGLRYSFVPTAHLIGCVSIRIFCREEGQNPTETDIVFSADVGAISNAEEHGGLAPARLYPKSASGVVVLESTYGDKPPRDPLTLIGDERLAALAKVVFNCVSKGPNARLIIPAFSLGRTTDLLADLYLVLTLLRHLTGVPKESVPTINIDSRLAKNYALELREAYSQQKGTGEFCWLNKDSKIYKLGGLELIRRLLSPDSEAYQEHRTSHGNLVVNWGDVIQGDCITIVIAGSGTTIRGKVCEEIIEHAKNPEATLLLCGYCPENSVGHHLREILEEDNLLKRSEMEPLMIPKRHKKENGLEFIQIPADAVKMNLEDMSPYYSGHADANSIQDFVQKIKKPDKVPFNLILVHGSNKSRSAMAKQLSKIANVSAVHCPSAHYPWFDINKKLWLFEDLGELRSSMSVSTFDKSGKVPSVSYVAKRIIHCLEFNYERRGFKFRKPLTQLQDETITFSIEGSHGTFFHKVSVKKDTVGGFCIQVDSLIGNCQTNEEFKSRCFLWEPVIRMLDKEIEIGYKVSATPEEVTELKNRLEVQGRHYPLLIVTKLGDDNECAKFLAKSLMLNVGPVRLVTMQGRKLSRAQGLGISAGEGLFFDEVLGHEPIKFSIINPLDSAPAVIACLNRIEDKRRELILAKFFQANPSLN